MDMRLDLNFVDHPKVKRLIRVAGHEGFYGLIRLFSMAGAKVRSEKAYEVVQT